MASLYLSKSRKLLDPASNPHLIILRISFHKFENLSSTGFHPGSNWNCTGLSVNTPSCHGGLYQGSPPSSAIRDEMEGLVMPKLGKKDSGLTSDDEVFARCFESTLVINPSGPGTTRLLLKGLHTRWGLYFVSNGSNDSPVESADSPSQSWIQSANFSKHLPILSNEGSSHSSIWSTDGSNPSPIWSTNGSGQSPTLSADGSHPSPIGSADVQETVSRIQQAKRFENVGDVTVQQSDINRVVAERHFQHVHLVRILFLSFFLDIAESLQIPFDSCKLHWLYIQLMPDVILKDDVFSVMLKTMGDAPHKYNASISRRIADIEHRLAPSSYREGPSRLFVVLDHAHVADSQLLGSFINEADGLTPCSALHELIKAWKLARSEIHLIVCGKKISTDGLMDMYTYNGWRMLEPPFYRLLTTTPSAQGMRRVMCGLCGDDTTQSFDESVDALW